MKTECQLAWAYLQIEWVIKLSFPRRWESTFMPVDARLREHDTYLQSIGAGMGDE